MRCLNRKQMTALRKWMDREHADDWRTLTDAQLSDAATEELGFFVLACTVQSLRKQRGWLRTKSRIGELEMSEDELAAGAVSSNANGRISNAGGATCTPAASAKYARFESQLGGGDDVRPEQTIVTREQQEAFLPRAGQAPAVLLPRADAWPTGRTTTA